MVNITPIGTALLLDDQAITDWDFDLLGGGDAGATGVQKTSVQRPVEETNQAEGPVSSEPTPIAGEFRVNTYTFSAQSFSSVTALDGGGFVLTWSSDGQDGSGWGIYGQRYTAAGVADGGEFQINAEGSSDQVYSSVAALNGGGFVVTWVSAFQDGDGMGIYAQRYTAEGTTDGSEFLVNTSILSDQSWPSVTTLNSGSFVVTWSSLGQDGSGYGIYAQRYTAAGVTDGGEFRVNASTASDQLFSSISALSNGGFVVTWTSSNQDGSFYGVYGQRYTAAGVTDGGEFRVNTVTSSDQGFASVAALDGGGFVVTWSSGGQDGSGYGIYAQRYTAAGAAAGGEFRVNSFTNSDQLFSSVTALDDGGFLVTWGSANQDGSGYGIYAQRYTAAGVADGAEFRVNETTFGTQFQDAIPLQGVTQLADGSIVATWFGNGIGDGEGVFARRFSLEPVNAAPAGTDATLTITEDTPRVLTAADFGFTDTDGDSFLSVGITTLPGAGTIRLNGTAVTAGTFVTAADINAGLLVYTPGSNGNGAGYSSFTFQVRDNGGSTDTDLSANTIIFNVSAVNDAPVITNLDGDNIAAIANNSSYRLDSGNDATVTDLDSANFDTGTLTVAITNPEAGDRVTFVQSGGITGTGGTVSFNGVQFGTYTGFQTATNVFTFDPDATPAAVQALLRQLTFGSTSTVGGTRNISITLVDGDGTANGGASTATVATTVTLSVPNVAPTGTDNTLTVVEDVPLVLSFADFGTADSDGTVTGIRITTLPAAASGTLYIDTDGVGGSLGTAVTSGQIISRATLDAGQVVFVPALNSNTFSTFLFQAQDNAGALDLSANQIRLNITPVNDAPVANPDSYTTAEDTPVQFSIANLLANDTDADGDTVQVTGFGPAENGTFDVNGGIVTFTPNQDFVGDATLDYEITDNNGGTSIGRATISVTAINDAPAGTDSTRTINEDQPVALTIADFGFDDNGTSTVIENQSLQVVIITTLPTAGTLYIDTDGAGTGTLGTAVVAGQSVSAADIAAGQLVFVPAANANGAGYASLTFQVQDDGGTANGGQDTDQSANTLTFDVTALNDAPVIGTGGGSDATFVEGSVPVAVAPALTISDVDSATLASATVSITFALDAANDVLAFVNNNAATFGNIAASYNSAIGVLTLTSAGATATVAQFEAALRAVTYANSSDNPGGSFRVLLFNANDGTENGTPVGRAVNVTPVNDAPVVANLQGDVATWTEGQAPTLLESGNALLSDVDSANFDGGSLTVSIGAGFVAAQDQLLIRATSGISTSGSAVLYNAVQIGTFAGAGAGGGPLVITFDADATLIAVQSLIRAIGYDNSGGDTPTAGSRTINWSLVDGDGTANGGSDTANLTSSVNVVAVDDAPVAVADSGATVAENATVIINVTGNDTDVDGGPRTVMQIRGIAAPVGTAITLASGATATNNGDGTITYNPNGAFNSLPAAGSGASNLSAPDSFTYTLNGGSSATVSLTVTGVDSNDTLNGTAGDDTLNGGIGNDTLNGLAGDDTLNGGTGADTMNGGLGNDVYVVDNAATAGPLVTLANYDYGDLASGSGSLTPDLVASGIAASPLNLVGLSSAATFNNHFYVPGWGTTLDASKYYETTLNPNGNAIDFGTVSFAMEKAGGGTAAWVLRSSLDNYASNVATGNLLNDIVTNFSVDLTNLAIASAPITFRWYLTTTVAGVTVGFANHQPPGLGSGSEIPGFDLAFTGNIVTGDRVVENVGEGTDTVQTTLAAYTLAANVEQLFGTSTTGQALTGNALDNLINGGIGDDTLNGGAGSNVLNGGNGDDTLLIAGGTTGANSPLQTANGGAGTDHLIADYSVLTEQLGFYVQTQDANGSTGFGDIPNGTRRIDFNSIERLTLTSGSGNDVINGTAGDDSITTGAGDDLLIGGVGNDILNGGANIDTAAFSGAVANYTISSTGGVITVTDNRAGPNDGVDTLTNIEFLNFAGQIFPVGPVAVDDTLAATEDTPVTFAAAQVTSNDTDVTGDQLTITGVTAVSGGTVVLNQDGTVTFTPDSNFNGDAVFDYTVSDGNGGSDIGRATVAVAAVNDAPTVTITAGPTLGGMGMLSQWTDLESGSGELPANIWGNSAADGANRVGLTVTFGNGLTGSVIYNNVSGLWNSFFSGIAYESATGFFTAAQGLHFLFDNGSTLPMAWENFSMPFAGNFDLDYNDSSGSHFRADVGGWNSAVFRTFSSTAAGGGGGYDVTEQLASSLKGTIVLADIDAGSSVVTATLSVGYGTIKVNVGNSGAMIVSGSGTGTVVLSGTIAQLNALLNTDVTSAIRYTANTDAPPGSTNFTVSVNDNGNTGSGGAQIGSATQMITIAAVNDAPVVDLNGVTAGIDTTASYTEGATPIRPLLGMTITDVDSGTLSGATVTIGTGFVAGDLLRLAGGFNGTTGSGITYSYNSGTGVLTLTGVASVADYQTTLAALSFKSNSDDPGTARDITVVVNDGSANSVAAHIMLTVSPVNDAPVNIVPGAQSGTTGSPIVFSAANGNALSVTDPDAGSGTMRVKLTADHGTMTLASMVGVTVTGDGTGIVRITGTLSAINAALEGLTYQSEAGYVGSDALTMTTSDFGNSGSGGPLTDVDSVAITVDVAVAQEPLSDKLFAGDDGGSDVSAAFASNDNGGYASNSLDGAFYPVDLGRDLILASSFLV